MLATGVYEQLFDNQLTPQPMVNVDVDDVTVPIEFAHAGQIVLSIAPRAVTNLALSNSERNLTPTLAGFRVRW
ncbi:MAG: Stringent starvation protein B [Sodalis sp.]|nr:MAG: Stringent starvation protein B [Sodalis sp.]